MKKKKKPNDEKEILRQTILKNNDNLWFPPSNIEFTKYNTNSWFSIFENNTTNQSNIFFEKTKTKPIEYKCKKVLVKLTRPQKQILHRWFKAYTIMYNKTLRLIKHNTNKDINTTSFMNLRTNHLKNTRDNIIEHSFIDKKYRIKTHILDTAIKLACANYKAALTNLKRGNIKHFRLRYWKHKHRNINIEIEPAYFKAKVGNINYKNKLCFPVFGHISYRYDGKKYILPDIEHACKLQYNHKENNYYLFIPEKVECMKQCAEKSFIVLDPGVRTFLTGISENEVIKIGGNMSGKLRKLLTRKDNITSNKYIPKYIRKKNELRINRKISYLVDELHWKTINYLTNKYETILIGDMSVKSIIRKNGVLSSMTKRVASAMSLYQFHQRLAYKCNIKCREYRMINEKYTSKMCSNCGNVKEDLGGNSMYCCVLCGKTQDRDVNGCRNICFKAL